MKISSIGIGFLSAALLCGQASGAETDFSAGPRALPMQQAAGTARATAMASAVVAVPQGAASLLWNPAGLGKLSCTELGLHHNTGLADTFEETVVFGGPLGGCREEGKGGKYGGLAASFGYVNYGAIEGRNSLGQVTENSKPTSMSGSIGWGMNLMPGFAAGAVLKANQASFDDTSYNTIAADVGVLWTPMPALNLGVTHTNLNLGNKMGGSLPVSGWRLGAGWNVNKHWLLAASGELQEAAMNRAQVGTEYLIGNVGEKFDNVNVVALRAGYQLNYPDPQLTGLRGLTFGLGYTITRAVSVDYAMLPTGELGNSHRLSLTFKFGCPDKQEPAPIVAYRPATAPEPVIVAAAPITAGTPIVIKSLVLEDSHFDFDKSTLKPEGMQALTDNIRILKENPITQVRIAGYTSMRGRPEHNQALSERRAKAVADYLIAEGIAWDRISTIGFGETRPAEYEISASKAHQDSDAAKANMRVVFEITVK